MSPRAVIFRSADDKSWQWFFLMLKTHVYDENKPKTRDNRRKKSESEVYLRYIAGEYFIYSFSTHIFGPIGIIYEKKVIYICTREAEIICEIMCDYVCG